MVAAEVSVVARVELAPLTERGVALRFSANLPPAWTDSAARESEAMGPADSRDGWAALGSVVFCRVCC